MRKYKVITRDNTFLFTRIDHGDRYLFGWDDTDNLGGYSREHNDRFDDINTKTLTIIKKECIESVTVGIGTMNDYDTVELMIDMCKHIRPCYKSSNTVSLEGRTNEFNNVDCK